AIHGYRRVALTSLLVSRLSFVTLVGLPFAAVSPEIAQNILLAVAGVSSLLGVIANNAWMVWMGELVPHRVRGRYFGKRTALCALMGTGAALSGGAVLDWARGIHRTAEALSGLAVFACVAGLVTTWLMRSQFSPGPRRRTSPDFAAFLQPYRSPLIRPLLGYQV